MAQIIDRPKITEITNDNVFLLDGPNGTGVMRKDDLARSLVGILSAKEMTDGLNFGTVHIGTPDPFIRHFPVITPYTGIEYSLGKISPDDLIFSLLDIVIDIPMRRTIWRGKDLGTSFTDEQKSQVAEGWFKDLFLGDYWTIDGRIYRIVDFDYWWNTGDTPCTTHHLVMMPDYPYEGMPMNGSDTTRGGYYDSDMHRGLDPKRGQASSIYDTYYFIEEAFGNNILNHQEYFTNAVTNGYPSGGIWVNSRIALPNEIMIYGTSIFAPMGNGTTVPANYTIDKTQLAGMRVNPNLILKGESSYWLRDVVSAAAFAAVHNDGTMAYHYASDDHGIRPVFGIQGFASINPSMPS